METIEKVSELDSLEETHTEHSALVVLEIQGADIESSKDGKVRNQECVVRKEVAPLAPTMIPTDLVVDGEGEWNHVSPTKGVRQREL